MIYGLDLFSGIGGITLALAEWVKPVAYVEIDKYCQGVLASRMLDGELPRAGIWDDVKTLSRSAIPDPRIDIIYGGFPCQDISIAGHGKGLDGERSGLFFEIVRLAKEFNPRFLFLENVPNIRTKGLREVTKTLSDVGYDCRWTVNEAADFGACHHRKRWWLLAYSKGERCTAGGREEWNESQCAVSTNSYKTASDSISNGPIERDGGIQSQITETIQQNGRCFLQDKDWIEAVTEICRMDDGIQRRVDRVKSLGNAVVPIQAKEAFKKLIGGIL